MLKFYHIHFGKSIKYLYFKKFEKCIDILSILDCDKYIQLKDIKNIETEETRILKLQKQYRSGEVEEE